MGDVFDILTSEGCAAYEAVHGPLAEYEIYQEIARRARAEANALRVENGRLRERLRVAATVANDAPQDSH